MGSFEDQFPDLPQISPRDFYTGPTPGPVQPAPLPLPSPYFSDRNDAGRNGPLDLITSEGVAAGTRAAIGATIMADGNGDRVITPDEARIASTLTGLDRSPACILANRATSLLSAEEKAVVNDHINDVATQALQTIQSPPSAAVIAQRAEAGAAFTEQFLESNGLNPGNIGNIDHATGEVIAGLHDPSLDGLRALMPTRTEGITLTDLCGSGHEPSAPSFQGDFSRQAAPQGRMV